MAMIFIPGMRPGNVSGAAGRSRRSRGPGLVFGPHKSGTQHSKKIVPYEEPRLNTEQNARREKEARARDVAQAYDMAKYQPNTTRERLTAVRAEAESVKV